MRRGNNLIARLYSKRGHGKIKCVSAIGARHAMFDIYNASELLLKSIDIGTANKCVVAHHRSDGSIDLCFDCLVLVVQISKRNSHWPSSSLAFASSRHYLDRRSYNTLPN